MSIKQIQDAIDMEKSQQALVPESCHYLFDVQRNNIAMALEVTFTGNGCIESIQGGKELPGLSHLCAEYDVPEGTRAHDKLGGEACGAEHPCTAGEGNTAKCIV